MSTFGIRSIGAVSSSLRALDAAPRQPDEGAPEAWLVFEPDAVPGLRNLRPGDVRVAAVEGARVRVLSLEAIDGTPITDLEPVLSPDVARR